MKLLVRALAGRATGRAASWRLFWLFLGIVFVAEALVMALLPWVTPSGIPSTLGGVLDATLLTLALAPVVWLTIVRPVQRLHDARGLLLDRVLSAQEEERTRIARDLHDGLGQNLTSMLLRLRVLDDATTSQAIHEHVEVLREIAAASLEDLRRMVRDTSPPVLSDIGLAAAVEQQFADVQAASGIVATLEWPGDHQARLPREVESALYRVIQETVTNAIKHADATQLKATVKVDPHEAALTISDDGIGFDVFAAMSPSHRPFGLLGIRERVTNLGGTVDFVSGPGLGTTVQVRVPLRVKGDDR